MENPDIPRAGRFGAPGGAVRCQARLGANINISSGNKKSTVLSKASDTRRFNVSPEVRRSEKLFKSIKKQNQRLICGLSHIYHLFIRETISALCSWLPASCKIFLHKKHVREPV